MASPRPPRIGIVLVEPVGVVRASLQMVFAAERDLDVLGVARDAEDGLATIRRLGGRTRVAMIGLELGGEKDALWLIRKVRSEHPTLVVLATGTDLNRATISRALFVGADGFVHKNSEPERFVEAARRAADHELVLEGLPQGALGEIIGVGAQTTPTTNLTQREMAVLSAAREGLTAREIGRRLDMRERTVTTHLNHIYRKLGANGRVAALAAASRMGIMETPIPPSSGTMASLTPASGGAILR